VYACHDSAADAAIRDRRPSTYDIGRRNVEGGAGFLRLRAQTAIRAVLAARATSSTPELRRIRQYYFVSFFNSNSKYLNFANVDQALLVTARRLTRCVLTPTQGLGAVQQSGQMVA